MPPSDMPAAYRVLVLGNAGVDLSLRLPHLPRPGESLVGGAFTRAPGGKGLNQAIMAARAGIPTHFCAPLGSDPDAEYVEARLRAEPIAALQLPRPGPPTDMSVIMVAADGENCLVSAGACADALPEAEAAAFAATAQPGDVLLMQGNLSQAATLAAARTGQGRGAKVMLNTAPLRWPVPQVLVHCWCVVANEGEALAITGRHGQAAAAALTAMGPALAVVTLARAGCVTPTASYPASPVAALDTTGAGDAFCGVLAAALAHRLPEAAAIEAAQRAASDSVTRPGALDSFPSSFSLL